MKKVFLLLILSIFFLSSVSAWSYDNSETYGCASAYAQVEGTYPKCDGNKYGSYCAGKGWYVDLDFEGDKFYLATEWDKWYNVDGDTNGLSGKGFKRISPGTHYLEINGGEFPFYIIYAWDYDRCDIDQYNYDWAWTFKGAGYLGTGALDGKKNVDCYKDKDCSTNQYCDKDGDWKNWKCENYIMGCTDKRALNYDSEAEKDDGSCNYECDKGETKCKDFNFLECKDRKWDDKGVIVNECDVECKEDSDCEEDEFVEDAFCSSTKNISQIYRDHYCAEEYSCDYQDEVRVIDTCEDICRDGKCLNRNIFEKIIDWLKTLFN
ncbi:MAG: hypothetical protein ACOCV1_01695 [Bacillota bacterium]